MVVKSRHCTIYEMICFSMNLGVAIEGFWPLRRIQYSLQTLKKLMVKNHMPLVLCFLGGQNLFQEKKCESFFKAVRVISSFKECCCCCMGCLLRPLVFLGFPNNCHKCTRELKCCVPNNPLILPMHAETFILGKNLNWCQSSIKNE